jgi:hypothetical protein
MSSRFADWYLTRSGYKGQQAPKLEQPMIGPNLYHPVAGDHGAHGAFDDRSLRITPQTWAIQHRSIAYPALAAACIASAGLFAGVRRIVKSV